MSRVLLIDADREHGQQVASALRSIACSAILCADLPIALSLLRAERFDAIVIVAKGGSDWELPIEPLRHAVLEAKEPAPVICLLRTPYRGPSERVYAARRGFKVAYER